jgi:hypothetical protein
MRSVESVLSIPGDVYMDILLWKSENSHHRNVQFRGLCGQMPLSTMEVYPYGTGSIGHIALYVPQLCDIFIVGHRLNWYGLTHVRSHAASYSSCIQFYVPFENVCSGSYFQWLQLQHRTRLTGVCVAAVSRCVVHCIKRLSFGSIRLQSHLGEVFLGSWLAGVETWRRWSRKEVGSAEDYIVSYKSKWNEWQPTYMFHSSSILLRIGTLSEATGDSNGRAIFFSQSENVCLFTCIHHDEWQLISHVW